MVPDFPSTDHSSHSRRPLAREERIVISALNLLYEISKRLFLQHAAAGGPNFHVCFSQLVQGPRISRSVTNPQTKKRIELSRGRSVRRELFQPPRSVR